VVGVAGLEPATPSSRTRCATKHYYTVPSVSSTEADRAPRISGGMTEDGIFVHNADTKWPDLSGGCRRPPQPALVFSFDAGGKMVSRTLKNLPPVFGNCCCKSMRLLQKLMVPQEGFKPQTHHYE
jgi:hypothetical protein